MKSSEYSDLKTFITVASCNSFATASRQLQMTPSAVSQIIKRLEDTLQIRLFNRTTRSVALTEAGKSLYERIRPALDEVKSALSEVKSNSKLPIGLVKIHSNSLAAKHYLEPIIGDFHLEYPEITLDIIVEDTVTDIIAEGYDIGVSLGEYVQKDMIAYPLSAEMRLVAAATQGYLDKFGIPKNPNDLRHHRCLNWRYLCDNSVYRWEFYEEEHWISYRVDGPLISTSRQLLLASALKDTGIIFLDESTLAPWFDKGLLIPLLRKYCHPFLSWHLYYPRHHYMSTSMRTFVDFVKKRYPLKGFDSIN